MPSHYFDWCWPHWGQDKMAANLQTTFSNIFSLMKMYKCPLNVFVRVQLIISLYFGFGSDYGLEPTRRRTIIENNDGYITGAFYVCNLFCIRSLVRHLTNTAEHFNRVFSTCAVRKTKTLGTEWMLIVDWLFFDMVYFQQWSRTDSKAPHVTFLGGSYWISYIHTRSK